jgi:protein-disulfide isomerase
MAGISTGINIGAAQLQSKNSIIAAVAVVVAAIVGYAGWVYFQQKPTRGIAPPAGVDLMMPSPLGENALGKVDAPVTIIEYASTTCPHCANFHQTTYPELKKRYIDTGKVRFIFREFPLNDIDFFAYMLTRCIEKEKFFPLLEVLFQQQEKWAVQQPMPPLTAIAKQAGFTDESIEACRKNKTVYDGVMWSSEHGAKLGVRSTPTFFINGKMHTGGITIEKLEEMIAPLLKE